MKPLISVIVPCYNQARYLDECLQSVFDQSYQDWECIIVNDGSRDNTKEVAKRWVNRDVRFKYLFKENGGLSSARNAGLEVAEGDYIQFLDSDDLLNKFKLEKQLQFFNEAIDIVICDYFPFDSTTGSFVMNRYVNPFSDLKNFKDDIILKWETELTIPCHCVLFKSKLLKENSFIRFEETLPNHEDWVFWVKLFYCSNGIHNLKEVLVSYRIHSKSMCADSEKMKEGFILACRMNLLFFENLNDRKLVKLCLEKMFVLTNKKEFKFRRFLEILIPPIVYRIIKDKKTVGDYLKAKK